VPLYDYDCANCGRRFEVIHGVHADSPTTCPLCGGGPVRKAITAPAVHYKGSGWAKKERRATASPGSSKSTTEGTGSSEGGSGGGSDGGSDGGGASKGDSASQKGDTKPDPKPEAKSGASATD
jgi:putative FmdB family regulatory protein